MPFYSQIPIIGVVGSRHSGKTATVETIVKGLTQKGYKIATAKHIHQKNFTIDTPGRDTWKHTQAGAHITLAVAANELTTIKKTDTTKLTINDIAKACVDNTDVIVLEGFRGLIAQELAIPKIITVKNQREIDEATKTFKPILAYATLSPETKFTKLTNPPIHITKNPQKLIQIIDKRIGPIIAKNRETKDSTTIIEINQQLLPLNPYVQKVTRNVLLSIITTLKGTNIKGNENIKITITNPNHQK